MYKCNDCGHTFNEPDHWVERHGEYFGRPANEEMVGCPYCGGGDYEEVGNVCPNCGAHKEELQDLCDDCEKELLEELKTLAVDYGLLEKGEKVDVITLFNILENVY